MGSNILKGLRILDLTWVLAGPYATRIMADFGAEVVKVQSLKTAKRAEANVTGYFNFWNRNKRSITLDLNHPEAIRIALQLIAACDVLIENFSPRVMLNWGLDYERLSLLNPRLIMTSMSAMGHSGPWRNCVGFGPTVQALSGLTYLTSFDPESPMGVGCALADHVAGLYAVVAVLAALERRERTGRGMFIDLSEYEAACTLTGPDLLAALVNPDSGRPQGNRADDIRAAPCGCYPCAGEDRWCVIAVFDDSEWQALCRCTADAGLASDARFATREQRKAHKPKLDELIAQWTVRHTPEQAVSLLQAAGVSAGEVQSVQGLANDPHLRSRRFYVTLPHPVLGETAADASPFRLDETGQSDWKTSPLMGEDNRDVLGRWLRLTEEEISALIRKGVIG